LLSKGRQNDGLTTIWKKYRSQIAHELVVDKVMLINVLKKKSQLTVRNSDEAPEVAEKYSTCISAKF